MGTSKFKKLISLLLVFLMIFTQVLLFSSCKKSGKTDGAISRADWIKKLAIATGTTEAESTTPYYSDVDNSDEFFDFIQACVEWNVIDGKGKFDPAADATYEFIAETCLKTISVEKLKSSTLDLKDVSDENLVSIFNDNVEKIEKPSDSVSVNDAEKLLDSFVSFSNSLEFKPVYEKTYTDSVNENVSPDSVSVTSDSSAAILETSDVKEGDIIFADPSENYPEGRALKVVSVNGNDITYTEPNIEDVFESITLSGTYEGKVIDVIGEGDTTVENVSYDPEKGVYDIKFSNAELTPGTPKVKETKTSVKEDANGSTATFEKGGVSATFSVSKIKINPEFDYSILGGVKSASCKATMSSSIIGDLKGEASQKDIKLFTIKVSLGATPFTADVTAYASVGIDGELNVSFRASMTAEASYRKGAKPKMSLNATNELDIDGHVNAYINVTPVLSLKVFGIKTSIINVSATVGANALASISGDLLDTEEPTCINMLMYVNASLGVNQKEAFTSSLLNCSRTIWDIDNSPFKYNFHYEFNVTSNDYKVVDKCTKGNSEKVTIPETKSENGNVLEEYFEDFAPIEDGGNLEPDFVTCNLKAGETKTITFSVLPEGYASSDIVFDSGNKSVVTVSGDGTITAVSSGSTVITAKTSDGKYSAAIKVSVETEYAGFNGLMISSNKI